MCCSKNVCEIREELRTINRVLASCQDLFPQIVLAVTKIEQYFYRNSPNSDEFSAVFISCVFITICTVRTKLVQSAFCLASVSLRLHSTVTAPKQLS